MDFSWSLKDAKYFMYVSSKLDTIAATPSLDPPAHMSIKLNSFVSWIPCQPFLGIRSNHNKPY